MWLMWLIFLACENDRLFSASFVWAAVIVYYVYVALVYPRVQLPSRYLDMPLSIGRIYCVLSGACPVEKWLLQGFNQRVVITCYRVQLESQQ